MLDLKFIRENPEKVRAGVQAKALKPAPDLDLLLRLDEERRRIVQELNALQEKRNVANKDIGRLKQSGDKAGDLIKDMEIISQKISDLNDKVGEIDERIYKIVITIPNIPSSDIPQGGPTHNKISRSRRAII